MTRSRNWRQSIPEKAGWSSCVSLELSVEETADALTLRDANGKDHKIAKKEIDSRTKSPKSLMPEDLPMTEAELIDLVEYLYSLK